MKIPEFCRRIVESSWFTPFIISVIVLAGVLVGGGLKGLDRHQEAPRWRLA